MLEPIWITEKIVLAIHEDQLAQLWGRQSVADRSAAAEDRPARTTVRRKIPVRRYSWPAAPDRRSSDEWVFTSHTRLPPQARSAR